ncbi:hypothetical protein K7X08_019226 [Anisodus acutangulus]|uniref:Uncharacterized protein n=1 Tax=Anisodus acutangulus TaxID=402998 RepID=A0A9Q1MUU5_9SOLA|nr:hypothetical protein K7X08_019226 [Anisodus acutangulus]
MFQQKYMSSTVCSVQTHCINPFHLILDSTNLSLSLTYCRKAVAARKLDQLTGTLAQSLLPRRKCNMAPCDPKQADLINTAYKKQFMAETICTRKWHKCH